MYGLMIFFMSVIYKKILNAYCKMARCYFWWWLGIDSRKNRNPSNNCTFGRCSPRFTAKLRKSSWTGTAWRRVFFSPCGQWPWKWNKQHRELSPFEQWKDPVMRWIASHDKAEETLVWVAVEQSRHFSSHLPVRVILDKKFVYFVHFD